MATTLLFTGTYTPPPPHAVPLLFAFTPGSSGSSNDITIAGKVILRGAVPVTVVAALPIVVGGKIVLRGSVQAAYDIGIPRNTGITMGLPWADAVSYPEPAGLPWGDTNSRPGPAIELPWTDTQASAARSTRFPWTNTVRVHNFTSTDWQDAQSMPSQKKTLVWQDTQLVPSLGTGFPWQDAQLVTSLRKQFPWADGRLTVHSSRQPWAEGKLFAETLAAPWGALGIVTRAFRFPWAEGVLIVGTGSPWTPYDPTIPPPEVVPVTLHFCELNRHDYHINIRLLFGIDPCGIGAGYVIPRRRVYYVINDIQFKRVSDDEPISILNGSLSIDRTSWAWGFNATLPYTERAKIEPGGGGPVEVELTLNGFVWRFLIEDYSYSETFNTSGLQVTGRSPTALLDEPYALKQSLVQDVDITSRQLADNELSRVDVPVGYSNDWSLIDPLGWFVPADSWAYQDLTAIQAIKQIAESVGGYVNSHPWDKVLIVQSAYPFNPWDWSTTPADIAVPRSIIKGQTLAWKQKPAYNGIYVSGENTGVLAFVKRTGTAGDLQPQMYAHPLITDNAAAAEYGRSFIASGGKKADVTVTLPMTVLTDIFTPGKLIQFTDDGFKGLVRGLTINFSIEGAIARLTQSATIERHY